MAIKLSTSKEVVPSPSRRQVITVQQVWRVTNAVSKRVRENYQKYVHTRWVVFGLVIYSILNTLLTVTLFLRTQH